MILSFDKRYSCKGFSGVAVRFAGYPTREAYDTYEDPETGETFEELIGIEDDLDSGMVYVIMIGDDHKHLVHSADLTEIDEEDYCGCCGQIGCRWG